MRTTKLTATIAATIATLTLTACGTDNSTSDASKGKPSPSAKPSKSPEPSPYMLGYEHGQERRNDPEYDTTSRDEFSVSIAAASHCSDWAAKTYGLGSNAGASVFSHNKAKPWMDGCIDGINDDPPQPTK